MAYGVKHEDRNVPYNARYTPILRSQYRSAIASIADKATVRHQKRASTTNADSAVVPYNVAEATSDCVNESNLAP